MGWFGGWHGAIDAGGGGGGDTTPPTVTILYPPPGSAIGPHTHLRFRINDNLGLSRALPAIKYPDGRYEIIHDGEDFTPDFTGSRTVFGNGWEYDVSRVGGFPMIKNPADADATIELVPFAFDFGGNEPA